jgi:hypothetical protein
MQAEGGGPCGHGSHLGQPRWHLVLVEIGLAQQEDPHELYQASERHQDVKVDPKCPNMVMRIEAILLPELEACLWILSRHPCHGKLPP